jgi:hypothetical protein
MAACNPTILPLQTSEVSKTSEVYYREMRCQVRRASADPERS